jgi:hypothetical protein
MDASARQADTCGMRTRQDTCGAAGGHMRNEATKWRSYECTSCMRTSAPV